ncbi:MAG: DNA pilot protein [Microvirus sp.]|nr:MAG: DNA pilot protein [Microvirus sp.]
MPGFLVPLLSAVAPAIAQTVGNIFQAKQERKFAKENWNQQNAYNTPAAQLQRYREAGMNPAYGAGMASGNAQPMPPAAASVAKIEIPNILQGLGDYQSLKNQVLEGDRIQAVTQGVVLDNTLKNRSMLDMLSAASGKGMKGTYESRVYDQMLDPQRKDAYGLYNPILLKYQLDSQRLNQNTVMNQIDQALGNYAVTQGKFGLNGSDSAFLRVLAQMWNGSAKTPDSMMPYVIGESAVNYLGKAGLTALPKIPFQKYNVNYQGRYFPSSKMSPNYNFGR